MYTVTTPAEVRTYNHAGYALAYLLDESFVPSSASFAASATLGSLSRGEEVAFGEAVVRRN